MKQLLHTMFITNKHVSFHLWRDQNLLKSKVSKCFEHDCRSFPGPIMFKKWIDSTKRVVTLAKIQCKGSISPSKFDGQLPNILVTCFCLCVVAATQFQNASSYFDDEF